jgi:hypothetical protein
MIKKFTLILFLSCAFLNNVSAESHKNDFVAYPKYEIEKIITLAKEQAVKDGYNPAEYYINRIEYDAGKKQWSVFFQGRVLAPGNHFLIWFDEKKDEITLMRGE